MMKTVIMTTRHRLPNGPILNEGEHVSLPILIADQLIVDGVAISDEKALLKPENKAIEADEIENKSLSEE